MISNNNITEEMIAQTNSDTAIPEHHIDQLKKEIAGQLIRAREMRGISQKQLAELSGLKQPAIARLEKMHCIPQIDTLLRVLYPLGYTILIVPAETKE